MVEEAARRRRWRRGDGAEQGSGAAPERTRRPLLDEAWCSLGGSAGELDAPRELLRAQAVHVRGLFEPGLLESLVAEAGDVQEWSTHSKADSWGPLAKRCFSELCATFGVALPSGFRLNLYADGQGKPQHQDRNAHCEDAGTLTVTASFGAPRTLRFVPLDGRGRVRVTQLDGDVFCFTSAANAAFTHGIERGPGARASLVVWGDGAPLSELVARLRSQKNEERVRARAGELGALTMSPSPVRPEEEKMAKICNSSSLRRGWTRSTLR